MSHNEKLVTLEALRDDVADYRYFVGEKDYNDAMSCFTRIGPLVRKLYDMGYSKAFISKYADLHMIAVNEHLGS